MTNIYEVREALLKLERSWMNQANFEDRCGRHYMAELIRGHIQEIQDIRKNRQPADEPWEKLRSVRDMKWEGKLR
jgi:hypothetical protein